MNKNVVSIEKLSHRYSKQWAIRDITFDINSRGIIGLLGSNGAGKSTTMNILCGVLNQSQGTVSIDGVDTRKNATEAKKLLGFLPQKPPLYPDLTVDEYLIHTAHLRRIEKKNIRPAVERAKERCGIAHFSKRLLKNLSGGYQQRAGIAQAIIHQPKLVVLDEPTNGLDPVQVIEVRKLIKEIGREHAVLISTHILSEVQAICEQIIMIEKGHLVFSGSIQEFNDYEKPNRIIAVMASPPKDKDLMAIDGVLEVSKRNPSTFHITFDPQKEASENLIEAAVKGGWRLKEVNIARNSLDDVFNKISNKKIIQS